MIDPFGEGTSTGLAVGESSSGLAVGAWVYPEGAVIRVASSRGPKDSAGERRPSGGHFVEGLCRDPFSRDFFEILYRDPFSRAFWGGRFGRTLEWLFGADPFGPVQRGSLEGPFWRDLFWRDSQEGPSARKVRRRDFGPFFRVPFEYLSSLEGPPARVGAVLGEDAFGAMNSRLWSRLPGARDVSA